MQVVEATIRDVRDFVKKVKADVCCLQESKLEHMSNCMARAIWGNSNCEWDFAPSEGSSGGIITLWNPSVFQKTTSWFIKELLVVNGYMIEDVKGCSIINVYARNSSSLRLELWDKISILVDQYKEDYLCVVGDFNSIRIEQERVGRSATLDRGDMKAFNNFIEHSNLFY